MNYGYSLAAAATLIIDTIILMLRRSDIILYLLATVNFMSFAEQNDKFIFILMAAAA